MGESTDIAYVDSSFNPWFGCGPAHNSPACKNCFARVLNCRWHWNGGGWGPGAPRKPCADSTWDHPPKWDHKAAAGRCGKDGKHWIVFAGDMCDLFDEEAPSESRDRLWNLIRNTQHLTWLLLTKRPENFTRFLPADWGQNGYSNVYLGVTAENREQAARRIPILLKSPARLHFLSIEPLLESYDGVDLAGIDWVIVGGESGPQARAFDLAWARSIQAHCSKEGIVFFMKQVGSHPVVNGAPFPILYDTSDGKHDVNGTMLANIPEDLRVRNWPDLV